ncbi:uncharacterized protein LODBEIA_P48990 [Lodderomyces beijingensis]|uniref:F-box protein Hrt3/FBXO9 C-terminal domain-containing protein n=1 Tax=Lodderomyces beijingensis TaxID=1775926 RepID=A0ABP0ZR93_9ASCO
MSTTAASKPQVNDLTHLDYEAIHYFEKAIEKEAQGLMSDAVENYRKAFKLNERVDTLYRSWKVPTTIKKLTNERGKNVMTRVDEKVVAKINVKSLIASFEHIDAEAQCQSEGPKDKSDVASSVAVSVSPLVRLPNDIWLYILEILVISSPESWFQMAITCKKFAYLGLGTSSIWRILCQLVYSKQVYEENQGRFELAIPLDQTEIVPQYGGWRNMLLQRPFVKFHGCYISVVNYYSEGARGESSLSWTNPVRTITYYRYLRFYPDGTVLKVLSIMPPNQVVSHLQRDSRTIPYEDKSEKEKESHKIYRGKWTISSTGEVHIRIDNGSVSYLIFHYYLHVKSAGIHKHGKLNWNKYFAVRKETPDDDRSGEMLDYSIRNEKPFKFSRVKSYTV